jgi:hypothetical protein
MSAEAPAGGCRWQTFVAAHILGILDPPDRELVAAHLPGCAACRTAMSEMAVLPSLLARVPADEAAAGAPVPDAAMLARLIETALLEREARRRRRAAWTAAASIVLVAAGVVAVDRLTESQAPGQRVSAAQGTVRASVRLTPISGGTALSLALSGVGPEQTCRLVAIADDGHREIAASWEASYHGTAHISGSAALPPARIAGLVVETFDDHVLVTLPVPPTTAGRR